MIRAIAILKLPRTLCLLAMLVSQPLLAADCVVLLHGLGRTSASLNKIARTLQAEGYQTANIHYPSRSDTIEKLASPAVESGLSECGENEAERIHVVTHSMGGILLRYYLENYNIDNLHRVVMLAPPNQGSKVVDFFRTVPGYILLNGPAGLQLGTDINSVPLQLGSVDFDLGVIAGNRTINLILSRFLDNPDDGKVTVASTKVDGMCAFIEMPVTHAMMMRNNRVIGEIVNFLQTGEFKGEGAENNLCD